MGYEKKRIKIEMLKLIWIVVNYFKKNFVEQSKNKCTQCILLVK